VPDGEVRKTPGVIAPPPLIFVAVFFLGWLFRDKLPRYQNIMAAMVLILIAAGPLLWGFWTMYRARTPIDPYSTPTALVTSGPFRFSRNPLYLSMHIFYVAVCLWTASMSSLFLLPLANAIMVWGVIHREERFLEAKFGDEYRVYRANVRRWL
jgi:protein-S-isoprenylcysteine O-methyltransferase Ste14